MFKKLAEPLLGEVILRRLSAHEEIHPGSRVLSGQGEDKVPDTNLRTCFPVLAPITRLNEGGDLRRKVIAACLGPGEVRLHLCDFEPSLTHSAAVSNSLNKMIRNPAARNGAAHPASDGVKNNWFLRIAQVLDPTSLEKRFLLDGYALVTGLWGVSTANRP